MSSVLIQCQQKQLNGKVHLSGSKSISNRVLLIQALCRQPFEVRHISKSDDTRIMKEMLEQNPAIMDVGHAGTAFRFLTAYLSLQEGTTILTGSARMKDRPIKNLVDALVNLGADITYMEKEGFPPLRIGPPAQPWKQEVTIKSDISSQFISAILMIAPSLPGGLVINLEGDVVSRPYIEMTIKLMKYFGAEVLWEENTIRVSGKPYEARNIEIEADWSGASYYYVMAALSSKADIQLMGVNADSLQGDANIVKLSQAFGVHSEFIEGGVRILKKEHVQIPPFFENDFKDTPDLAQGLAVLCAGFDIQALFTGLETLRVKETDRVRALANELRKTGHRFHQMPSKFSPKKGKTYYMLEKDDSTQPVGIPEFDTYDDHRMALSFACLGVKYPVIIHDAEVVTKSYPGFWSDIKNIGVDVITT